MHFSDPSSTQVPGPTPTVAHPNEVRREIVEFVKVVVWFLVLFFMLRLFVIEGYEVQGPSMEPTLWNGERILVSKLPLTISHFSLFKGYEAIEEGDVVVLKGPDGSNKRYVKRVVAKGPKRKASNTVNAGGHVEAADLYDGVPLEITSGRLYVNNVAVDEEYLSIDENKVFTSAYQKTHLSPGKYFVLGDNRPVSKDSRNFDAIDEEDIIGKAVLRFWPLNRFSLLR